MHRSFDQENVAFLALDAKVVIAGFREPLTDMKKPRYWYSHTMIMGAPFCCVRSRLYLFPLSLVFRCETSKHFGVVHAVLWYDIPKF